MFMVRSALHEVDAETGEEGVRECKPVKSP